MSPADTARKKADSFATLHSNAHSGFVPKAEKVIRRVLVIDDTPAIQRLVKRILALANIEAIVASDGEEGVAMHAMLGDSIDAVLLDYEMPKMDGLQALKQIMSQRPQTPVVFFSGAGGNDWIERAHSAGAAAILKKPFLPSDLVRALHTTVQEDLLTELE
jgi:hypothetical protein